MSKSIEERLSILWDEVTKIIDRLKKLEELKEITSHEELKKLWDETTKIIYRLKRLEDEVYGKRGEIY